MRRILLARPLQYIWPSTHTQIRFLTSQHTGDAGDLLTRPVPLCNKAVAVEVTGTAGNGKQNRPRKTKKPQDFVVRFVPPHADQNSEMNAVSARGVSRVKELSQMSEYGLSFLRVAGSVAVDEGLAESVAELVQKATSVTSASVMPDVWTPHAIRVLQALAEKPSLDYLNITLSPGNPIEVQKEVAQVLCSFPPFKESLKIFNSNQKTVWKFLFTNGRQRFLGQASTSAPMLVLHTKKGYTPMYPLEYHNFRVLRELLGDFLFKQETPGSNDKLIIYSYPDKKL